MVKGPPHILQFAEYRKFLLAQYQFLKLNNRKFSHRFINSRVGVKSTGWFGDVLAGRQKLKPAQVKAISALLRIGPESQKCLRALVDIEAAKTPEDIAVAYESWYESKGVGMETVEKERFKFYDRWYFSAMRELMAIHPGLRDPEILASALDPQITPKQARDAISLLNRLGFIASGDPGPSKTPMPALVKDAAARTRHWKKMMASMMKLGQRALDRYDRDQRNFSGLTLTFSPEGLKKAGEEIAALRKRLLYLSEREKKSDRVYNCVFQIYPVSTPLEASRV